MDFSPILKHETCAKCKICCEFKLESLIYVPKGIEVKKQENGMFVCIHRSGAGCLMGKNKPMECLAWPFSISKRGNELLLVLERSCKELNKNEKIIGEAKKFALDVVAPVLLEYSKQHLDTLREYDGKNEIIEVYDDFS